MDLPELIKALNLIHAAGIALPSINQVTPQLVSGCDTTQHAEVVTDIRNTGGNPTEGNTDQRGNNSAEPTELQGGLTDTCDVGGNSTNPKTFAQIVSGELPGAKPIRERALPRIVGGNIAIAIDEEEYNKGLAEFANCLIGRLVLARGDQPYLTKELKTKLSNTWGIKDIDWRITPLGKGFFTLKFATADIKASIFAKGSVVLRPGIFRISQWSPNFNPNLQKQTNAQVWVRIYELSMEYWKPDFLYDIAKGIGTPLRIDKKTLDKELGLYARILVDVDFAKEIPEQILIQRKDFEFFVYIEYERCPSFCKQCGVVGHELSQCRSMRREERRNEGNPTIEKVQRKEQEQCGCGRRGKAKPEGTIGRGQKYGRANRRKKSKQ